MAEKKSNGQAAKRPLRSAGKVETSSRVKRMSIPAPDVTVADVIWSLSGIASTISTVARRVEWAIGVATRKKDGDMLRVMASDVIAILWPKSRRPDPTTALVFRAATAYIEAAQKATVKGYPSYLDHRGILGDALARLAWKYVLGAMTAGGVAKSAFWSTASVQPVALTSPRASDQLIENLEARIRNAGGKRRRDTSPLIRAQRVYNVLAYEAPVLPRPDTHEPPRKKLKQALTGARNVVVRDLRERDSTRAQLLSVLNRHVTRKTDRDSTSVSLSVDAGVVDSSYHHDESGDHATSPATRRRRANTATRRRGTSGPADHHEGAPRRTRR
jgi:hypothetical protein